MLYGRFAPYILAFGALHCVPPNLILRFSGLKCFAFGAIAPCTYAASQLRGFARLAQPSFVGLRSPIFHKIRALLRNADPKGSSLLCKHEPTGSSTSYRRSTHPPINNKKRLRAKQRSFAELIFVEN